MHEINRVLFKSIAIIAFIGLTIGSSAVSSSANARTGSGGMQDQGATDTINGTSGSGTGGSTDSDTSPSYHDTGPNYHGDQQGVDQEGASPDSNTGASPGGSTDTDSDTGPSRLPGTGPHYGTAPLGGPSGNGMGDPNPSK
jgi:hypothetical protein